MIQTKIQTIATTQKVARPLPNHLISSLTLIGLGNIGALLAELLARWRALRRVTLVDFQLYDPGNIRGQNIVLRDVGLPKVQVQARKMRQIAPDLQVQTHFARFEDLSLSDIRSDLLVSCLDSRIARTYVNEAAYRLNVPLLDGAVDGAALQGRVGLYVPASDAPCLECQFAEADYAAAEQVDACSGPFTTAPTNAPASIGAFVAAMQAVEIQKMDEGRSDQVLVNRQVFVDLRHHKQYVTRFCRNPNCRFDHQVWNIESFAAGEPRKLADLFDVMLRNESANEEGNGSLRLRVRGQPFIRRLVCTPCRRMQPALLLERRLTSAHPQCAGCGGPMSVSGFDKTEWLDRATLEPRELKRSLKSLGFKPGDAISIRNGDCERHFEWTGKRARANDLAMVPQN